MYYTTCTKTNSIKIKVAPIHLIRFSICISNCFLFDMHKILFKGVVYALQVTCILDLPLYSSIEKEPLDSFEICYAILCISFMICMPSYECKVLNYYPEVIWSDGDWEADENYWKSKEFLAWLFSDSPVKETVVVNDRWGKGISCHHGSFYNCKDRYNPGLYISYYNLI